MNKIKLLTVSLLLSNIAFGQTINIQSGVSLSKLIWSYSDGSKKTENTLVGNSTFVGIDYLDKTYFNLSTNIGSLSKGGQSDMKLVEQWYEPDDILNEKTTSYKAKNTLNYVSLNSTVNFKYPIKEKLVPFVNLGPRIDYLTAYCYDFPQLIGEFDELYRFSYGLIMGGGIKYNFQRFQIGITADRYVNFNTIGKWTRYNIFNDGSKAFTPQTIKDITYTVNASIAMKL